jgi:hypothetical protein
MVKNHQLCQMAPRPSSLFQSSSTIDNLSRAKGGRPPRGGSSTPAHAHVLGALVAWQRRARLFEGKPMAGGSDDRDPATAAALRDMAARGEGADQGTGANCDPSATERINRVDFHRRRGGPRGRWPSGAQFRC